MVNTWFLTRSAKACEPLMAPMKNIVKGQNLKMRKKKMDPLFRRKSSVLGLSLLTIILMSPATAQTQMSPQSWIPKEIEEAGKGAIDDISKGLDNIPGSELAPGRRALRDMFADGYVAAASEMKNRSKNLYKRGLSNLERYLLRKTYGKLVDRVALHFGARLMDQIGRGAFKINTMDFPSDGQTFGYNIYYRGRSVYGHKSNFENGIGSICHETEHSKQYEDAGRSLKKFGRQYWDGYSAAKFIYEDNKWEVRAYDQESRCQEMAAGYELNGGYTRIDPQNKFGIACITNKTNAPVSYAWRWGDGEWKWVTIPAGQGLEYAHTYNYDNENRSQKLQFSYGAIEGSGVRVADIELVAFPTKGNCQATPFRSEFTAHNKIEYVRGEKRYSYDSNFVSPYDEYDDIPPIPAAGSPQNNGENAQDGITQEGGEDNSGQENSPPSAENPGEDEGDNSTGGGFNPDDNAGAQSPNEPEDYPNYPGDNHENPGNGDQDHPSDGGKCQPQHPGQGGIWDHPRCPPRWPSPTMPGGPGIGPRYPRPGMSPWPAPRPGLRKPWDQPWPGGRPGGSPPYPPRGPGRPTMPPQYPGNDGSGNQEDEDPNYNRPLSEDDFEYIPLSPWR